MFYLPHTSLVNLSPRPQALVESTEGPPEHEKPEHGSCNGEAFEKANQSNPLFCREKIYSTLILEHQSCRI